MAIVSKRLAGPAQLATSATTVYTATVAAQITRGRVSNPTGIAQTFTMSIGVDSAGTRIYSGTVVPPNRGVDIYGPFSLQPGDIVQAFGSSTSLVLELNGNEGGPVQLVTNFPNGEFTNGNWLLGGTNGLDWTDPTTSLNTGYGTQSTVSPVDDDSVGLNIAAFPPNQYQRATIYKDPTLTGNTYEVELFFRGAMSANSITGYEVNLSYDGSYSEIVRWNGGLNQFTYVSQRFGVPTPVTGDVLEAQIVGTFMTVWLTHNGSKQMINDIDVTVIGGTVYTTGKVGVAFWHGDGLRRYGFTDWLAQGL